MIFPLHGINLLVFAPIFIIIENVDFIISSGWTGSHHGHAGGPPHNHPHASFPMVFLPPGHSQLPPGVNGPNGPGGPQGVQILPLGSSTTAGMAAMGMAIPQIHYIQQAPGGNQAVHRLV